MTERSRRIARLIALNGSLRKAAEARILALAAQERSNKDQVERALIFLSTAGGNSPQLLTAIARSLSELDRAADRIEREIARERDRVRGAEQRLRAAERLHEAEKARTRERIERAILEEIASPPARETASGKARDR